MPETKKTTLLLVDDKIENLFALEQILEDSGYTLLLASSGQEALRMTLKHQIDLILLDVQMPQMDGFQVAECLKQSQKTKHIPIIFLTAINKECQYLQKGFDLGAMSYLTKPIDPDQLKQKITLVLRWLKLCAMPRNLQEQS
jgi:CheY-like chemotaxis protein